MRRGAFILLCASLALIVASASFGIDPANQNRVTFVDEDEDAYESRVELSDRRESYRFAIELSDLQ